jgi:anti-sigma factor RsiW
MICGQWRDQLDAYTDDVQDPSLVQGLPGLEEHLRTCSSCTTEVLTRLQLKRATRVAAMRYTPSPDFRLRVEKSIQIKRRPGWIAAWLPSLAAATALILLAAVSVQVWFLHAAREEAVSQLLDLHVATIASANPVDVVSTDRHTVKPWFQGKLPFTFNLPELENSPYKLLGGRLVYLHNRPGAQLLFELRKHELSLFISQEGGLTAWPGRAEFDTRRNGFSVESWSQDGLRYAIVSDAGPSDVRGLGNLLKGVAGQ